MTYQQMLDQIETADEGKLRAFATCILDAFWNWPEALKALRNCDKYFDEKHNIFNPKTNDGWDDAHLLNMAWTRIFSDEINQ